MNLVRRWNGRIVLLLAVVGTIGCDQVTKHVATTTLGGSPDRSYFGDIVRIGYVENPGGFPCDHGWCGRVRVGRIVPTF